MFASIDIQVPWPSWV